jgi:hypothetical protein
VIKKLASKIQEVVSKDSAETDEELKGVVEKLCGLLKNGTVI